MIKVSLIASSVRHQLYPELFKSLEGTSVEYEVVFAGTCEPEVYPWFKYITTANIKPAQCYEIARRGARGETILWTADDCEFNDDVVGKAYNYWKAQNDEKLILSIQTCESGYNTPEGQLFDMTKHVLLPHFTGSSLMAPLGLMSRKFMEDLGGFDKKYVCGQYENLAVIMAMEKGGRVEIFGDKDCFIDIDHLGKSIEIGESTDQESFIKRPFASGYVNDRECLLQSCFKFRDSFKYKDPKHFYDAEYVFNKLIERGEFKQIPVHDFEPYEDEDILTKSQSNKGQWE